jgi:CelD/BcsL family acetyltransferase involved in cellulose biosynthesis
MTALLGARRTAVVDPRVDERWRALMSDSPGVLPFHHPAWLTLIGTTYRHPIQAWVIEDDDGKLVAGLPFARVSSWLTGRRLVSLPFSDLCPPLLAGGAGEREVHELAERIVEDWREGDVAVELRSELPVGAPAAPHSRFWHHVVPLESDVAAVQGRFAKAHVRNIKKARKGDVRIRFATDLAALDAFYALHLQTRRHQGVPTQPKRFIRGFSTLFEQGMGEVALAEWRGSVLAAAVFLRAGGTVVYKYGASDRAHLDKRPNNLLFMEAIAAACASGATALDLGRTDLDNEGLRAFKLGWGAQEAKLAYARLSTDGDDGEGGGGLPRSARTLISASPASVGRAVGELLYRHYA